MFLSEKICKISDFVLDFLFPKFCLGCGKEGRYICKDCDLFLLENSFICPVCGNSSFFGETHNECLEKNGLDGLISGWEYNGIIKKAVHRIKYNREHNITREIVWKFFNLIERDEVKRFSLFLEFLMQEDTVVVYVPMFRKKERQRGFNQSEIIAREIKRLFDKKVFCLLKKTKETLDQASLKREERLQNLKDVYCFSFSSFFSKPSMKDYPAQNVVLVDDVFTTGATLRECCKVLKKAGVEKVWGFTLARTA